MCDHSEAARCCMAAAPPSAVASGIGAQGVVGYVHQTHCTATFALFRRVFSAAVEGGGIVKGIRVPDGQRISNSRIKPKGDVSSELFGVL